MRLLPLATTLLLAVTLLPAGVAQDSQTYDYVAGPSAFVLGAGLGIYPCPGGCDLDGDGENDYPFDHGPWTIPDGHSNVIITAEDLVYGPNVGLSACWYNPDGDTICDDEDVSGGPGCGPLVLLGAPFSGGHVKVFLITLLVTEDLSWCGATAGTITVSSF